MCVYIKSCNILEYRVAVHIADVSYFVKEGTELDKAAANRTTSTYLVQKVSGLLRHSLVD